MASDTATLSLEGSVDLATFSAAMESFRMLLDGLSEVFAPGYIINWEITGLRAGSAVTAVRGVAESREAVHSVITALDAVGEAVEHRRAIPYNENVAIAVRSLTGLADGRLRGVRLITAEREYILTGVPVFEAPSPPQIPKISSAEESGRILTSAPSMVEAFGAVEGTIGTLSGRGRPRFTLYDQSDRRVTGHLDEDQRDEVAPLWGKRVVVEGLVQRDSWTGAPLAIRRITSITPVVEGESGEWRRARGAVPRGPSDSRAEDVIRRLRDA